MTCVDSINHLDATIECEHPTLDLYKFVGRMNINSVHQAQSRPADEAGLVDEPGLIDEPGLNNENFITSSSQISLSALNLLLRGTKLKNTNFVFGMSFCLFIYFLLFIV